MAISLTSLSEEILNRQERAIVRGIYRACQLHEARLQLDKMIDLYSSDNLVKNEVLSTDNKEHYLKLRQYLLSTMAQALINTKVPAIASNRRKEIPSPAV